MICALSEETDQPAHPLSLIRIFARHYTGSQGSNVKHTRDILLGIAILPGNQHT